MAAKKSNNKTPLAQKKVTKSRDRRAEEAPAATTKELTTAQAPPTETTVADHTGAETTAETAVPETPTIVTDTAAKSKKGRKTGTKKSKADGDGDGVVKKVSALDAAAKVLGEAAQALGCKEMIEAMAAKGYWSSPAGRTPAGTLYAAILREIATKGDAARFQKTERGKFALRGPA